MNALQSMEKYVQERMRLFMNKMAAFSSTAEQLNLGKWCHFFAFDVIGELVSPTSFIACDVDLEPWLWVVDFD